MPCIDGLYCGDDPTGDHAGDVLNPGFDQSGVQAWKRHKRIQEAHAQNAAAAAAAAAGPYQHADSQYVLNQPYQPATSHANGCRLYPCTNTPFFNNLGQILSDGNTIIDGASLTLSILDVTELDRAIGSHVLASAGSQAGPPGVVAGAVIGPLVGEVVGDTIGNRLDDLSIITAVAGDILNDSTGFDPQMNALIVGQNTVVDVTLNAIGRQTNSGINDTVLNTVEFVGYDILLPNSDFDPLELRLHLGSPFISVGPVDNRYDYYK